MWVVEIWGCFLFSVFKFFIAILQWGSEGVLHVEKFRQLPCMQRVKSRGVAVILITCTFLAALRVVFVFRLLPAANKWEHVKYLDSFPVISDPPPTTVHRVKLFSFFFGRSHTAFYLSPSKWMKMILICSSFPRVTRTNIVMLFFF